MSNIISGTNISLTEGLKLHIKKQVEKISQFDSNITNTRVFLKKDADKYVAEVQIHSSVYKDEIMATCKSDDMYNSITSASKKMITRLKRFNQRIKAK
jgi:ribosomal subunit interface protein